MMKRKLHSILFLVALMSASMLMTSCGDDDPEITDPVFGNLRAKIDVSAIAFISDANSIDGRRIKANQLVSFADNSTGNPDSRQWTFEEGPASASDSVAAVTWSEQVGQVRVILTITRSADEATDADTLDLQVGTIELLNRTVFGLEDKDSEIDALSKWFSWTPNDGTTSVAIETADGANGTSQSLKMTAQSGFGEFQLRPHENGPEFLVSLESNTTYEYSFYLKGSESFTLSEATFLNVKNDEPKESWYTPFWSGEEGVNDIMVTTDWKKFTYEFTTADLTTFGDDGYADGTADNAGPFFKHFASFTGSELNVWIDEISLKEKDE
jgi:hypothetical protein